MLQNIRTIHVRQLAEARGGCVRRSGTRQRGLALVELMLAAALAVLLAVWGAGAVWQRAEDARSRAVGTWLEELGQGMAHMIEAEYAGLADPLASLQHVYANRYAPTVAELKRFGYLPVGFPEQSAWGGTPRLSVWREGDCPGVSCQLQALAVAPPPTGGVDIVRMSQAQERLQGRGGGVLPHRTTEIRGAVFSFANPLPDGTRLAPGSVAVYHGLDAARLSDYVRMRDERDPGLRGDLTVDGSTTLGGQLRTEGRIVAGEYLRLDGQAEPRSACPQSGLLAWSRDGSGLLACANGAWNYALGDHFGGVYFYHSSYGCSQGFRQSGHNLQTGACSCPAGFTPTLVAKYLESEIWTHTLNVYLCRR